MDYKSPLYTHSVETTAMAYSNLHVN